MRERSQVPLPEVAQHTEYIVFGNLGLPLGFDEERLTANLNALDRIRKVVGLNELSIIRGTAYQDSWSYSVGGIDSAGNATGTAAQAVVKEKRARATVDYPTGTPLAGPANAVVTMRDSTIKQVIEASTEKRKHFDPGVLAKGLNIGLKEGLNAANSQANMSKKLKRTSIYAYALTSLGIEVPNMLGLIGSGYSAKDTLLGCGILELASLPATPFMFYMLTLSAAALRKLDVQQDSTVLKDLETEKDEGKEVDEALIKKLRWNLESAGSTEEELLLKNILRVRKSLFVGASPDRYLAARGLIKSSHLIRARS